MAKVGSGSKPPVDLEGALVIVKERLLPSIQKRGLFTETCSILLEEDDWRASIIEFLLSPSWKTDKRIRMFATQFILLDGELFKKGIDDDILLRCLWKIKAMRVMVEIHEGICGAHQAGIKMKWLLKRHGYYWPGMLKDCIDFGKGCQECQRHEQIQRVSAIELQSISILGPSKVGPWI